MPDRAVSTILGDLGVAVPKTLTIGGILEALGFSSATGQLTLSQLLGDLGLSNLPLDLSNLGDLSGLTLGGLLGDLGLGDVANVTADPLGGMITELVDVVPQQILAALGL